MRRYKQSITVLEDRFVCKVMILRISMKILIMLVILEVRIVSFPSSMLSFHWVKLSLSKTIKSKILKRLTNPSSSDVLSIVHKALLLTRKKIQA
jgi:hypothetical protein